MSRGSPSGGYHFSAALLDADEAARIYVPEREAGILPEGRKGMIDIDPLPERRLEGLIRTVSSVPQSRERNSPFR